MARLTGPLTAFAGDSTDRSTTAKHALGTVAVGEKGKIYTYVKAGADIAAKNVVKCNGSTLGYDDVRKVSGAAAGEHLLGVAEEAFTSGQYGWIVTSGVVTALVDDSTAVGSILTSSAAVAGALALSQATDVNAGHKPAVALTTGASSSTAGAVICLG